jgi:hypothetical protein
MGATGEIRRVEVGGRLTRYTAASITALIDGSTANDNGEPATGSPLATTEGSHRAPRTV